MTAFQKIPLVPPAEHANTQAAEGVSRALKDALTACEAQPGILAAGLATVQPWLDIPDLGSAVVVVADGDTELAKGYCDQFSRQLWQRRGISAHFGRLSPGNFRGAPTACRPNRAGRWCRCHHVGAPGDGTWILAELLKYDWTRLVLATLVDPSVVAAARRAGMGATYAGAVGGIHDPFSQPLVVRAVVERLFDARFRITGHLARNLAIDMGPSAVLRLGEVRLIVTSHSGPHFSPELFCAAGLDPFAAAVLVAKSPCGFRAG